MSHEILFQEFHGAFWLGPVVLAGEDQAQKFLKKWRNDFLCQHGELPAEGVDFKLSRRETTASLVAGVARAAADQGPLEYASYNLLSEIREAFNEPSITPRESLPDMARAKQQALAMIYSSTDDPRIMEIALAGLRGRAAGGGR